MSNSEINILREFLTITDGTEIPEKFATWCGLSMVSSVLERKISLDMGTFTIFPNLYVILVAGSGRFRKSTTVDQVENILNLLELNRPNLLPRKITPEALIHSLQQKPEGYIIADELAVFLNEKNYDAMAPLLISFFDCKSRFEYRTKGGGSEVVEKAQLGLLAGSTIDWIKSAIPEDGIGSGLTSRMIFVLATKPPLPVPRPTFNDTKKKALRRVLEGLNRIAALTGEVELTDDAWKLQDEIYIKWQQESPLFDNKNLSGYASRRQVHLLKLAINMAASTGSILVGESHVDAAEKLLLVTEYGMPKVMDMLTSSKTGDMVDWVLGIIQSYDRIGRSELSTLTSRKLDSKELDRVISTLLSCEFITHERDGKKTWYSFNKDLNSSHFD